MNRNRAINLLLTKKDFNLVGVVAGSGIVQILRIKEEQRELNNIVIDCGNVGTISYIVMEGVGVVREAPLEYFLEEAKREVPLPKMNRLEAVIEKLKTSEDGKVELTRKEIKMIETALKLWNAMDDVLDEAIGLNDKK